MEKVKSSNIDQVGYDPASKVMTVRFHNGGTYQYSDVSAEKYQQFRSSPSLGSFLHRHIKPNHAVWQVELENKS